MFFQGFNRLTSPEDIISSGTDDLVTRFITKEDFLNKYNREIKHELLHRIFQSLLTNTFNDIVVFGNPCKSCTPNIEFERLLNRLDNFHPCTKHYDNNDLRMIKVGMYGRNPYIIYHESKHIVKPDFIAFNKRSIPDNLRYL